MGKKVGFSWQGSVGRGLKAKSWNNTRADLSAFFAWCEKAPHKWITTNPVADVDPVDVPRGLPEILRIEQAQQLMEFLKTYTGCGQTPKPAGFLVPYFSLALFAGIRPAINNGELVRIGRLTDTSKVLDLTPIRDQE